MRDDSPEDESGGAAFFLDASDVIITYRDGTVEQGRDIRFGPVIESGLERRGFLSADGDEQISLLYDFDRASFVNRAAADKSEMVSVEFRLVLANDYQVWMSSDRQLGILDPGSGRGVWGLGEEGFLDCWVSGVG